ncbi:hypothetical protein T492DRAFT_964542 [Pavlovales sp. CCMP2436]|nr:hypothetical protein T492DRAFT_964542 [Pavlovales sp. CCMP2436]
MLALCCAPLTRSCELWRVGFSQFFAVLASVPSPALSPAPSPASPPARRAVSEGTETASSSPSSSVGSDGSWSPPKQPPLWEWEANELLITLLPSRSRLLDGWTFSPDAYGCSARGSRGNTFGRALLQPDAEVYVMSNGAVTGKQAACIVRQLKVFYDEDASQGF